MRLLSLTNLDSMAQPLAGLHPHPLQYWLKKNCKDSSQSVQRVEAKSRGFSNPALVAHLQTATKVNMQILDRGSGDNRCLQ